MRNIRHPGNVLIIPVETIKNEHGKLQSEIASSRTGR
jgi:hypothetical protein